MPGLGTAINVATIIVGTAVGVIVGERFPERIRTTLLAGIGLLTVCIGIQSFLKTANALMPLGALLIGGLIGELLQIERGLEKLGEWLQRKMAKDSGDNKFAEGFVIASLTYCVGALVIVGAIQDGINHNINLLTIKATLDGFVSIIYASVYGFGVGFSAVLVLVVQGGFTIAGAGAGSFLNPRMVSELTATGGVLIFGIGLRLLDLKKISLANFLPSLAVAPILVAIFAR